ncbi:cytochrome c oxidase subunit II [Salinibacterium sp. NSLL150]|uniref:aa3-type cytochrome oxidase subunit II n=1 Tax=unclassified Salinibacterium TaxID=2632331 RepID=UPI0018CEBB73|nr:MULTISPECIES: cytochrome c oxidase subunit II [unclassified Salinibacterium]MBH0024268.1 cytochrome c oxidase subunit II [Salinibacterium sp. SWN248]MBH0083592.1 cytochrome c oxidase subunit II [Salinibacterium sp. SWN167]MBH0099236.1 cytochrome c oxidase subunit II [Salinibacterium sp. NSLL35]MBH0101990.1 cytochrome c oxidase subunit II [Salinibacterium sp. NSLL150]MBH0104750.1 cytochrome c oxidase subunit II [Salinibacterium sp. NSLL16]
MFFERSQVRSNRRIRLAAIPLALVTMLVLTGCTQDQLQGYLPGSPDTTNHTSSVIGLWVTSWIVLLVVGVITWGLIIWAAVVYRRRRGQTGLPVQLRYNMPIEIFYTVVPLILVLGFFAFTARDQAAIEAVEVNPDVQIEVIGKRWAWDFNYIDENVYSPGVQADFNPDGTINVDSLPQLVLPVDKKVEIKVEARDVAHSFWVVDFLYKKDMLPGKTNYMYFIPTKEGTYQGKCAELCGEYHSLMLFTVKVVSEAEYEDYIDAQRAAGFEGQLGLDYNVNQNLPGNGSSDEE